MMAKVGDGNKYLVKLDGSEVKGVVFADDGRNFIDMQVCDKSGRVMIDRANECVVMARLHGNVEITKV